MELNQIKDSIDTNVLLSRPLTEWYKILTQECQVYVCEGNYLGKKIDEINYKFCSKEEAEVILEDNLYILLHYFHFKESNEQIDERIQRIVKGFLINIKSRLIRVSFDENTPNQLIQYIPNYCCAFRNGVYDFKNNKWLFKYNIVPLNGLSNYMYSYNENYAIMWYFNYDFEDIGININETSLEEFINLLKELTKSNQNYCFELMYNICHDNVNRFDLNRFKHLCEICGYLLIPHFTQHLVLLIGSGQNGKNSLFDGCFTNRLVPKPSALDLDTIEEDKFVTGILENTCHNIFLETSPKAFTKSNMIKALTGSMIQSINHKGVPVYSGLINCKYLFAGNDRDYIKFKDNTVGFLRRVNLYEIFYQWDYKKTFLKKGDYYDTSFSDDLHEIKNDLLNNTIFVYLAMYGIKEATKDFTSNFKFTYNEWGSNYEDIDQDLKESLSQIDLAKLFSYLYNDIEEVHIKTSKRTNLNKELTLFDLYGVDNYKDFLRKGLNIIHNKDKDEEAYILLTSRIMDYFSYISLSALFNLYKDKDYVQSSFSKAIKKIYHIKEFERFHGNRAFVKVLINDNHLTILK